MATADASITDSSNEPSGFKMPDRSSTDLVEGFSNLGLIRQVGLMVGLAASVALGFAVVLWSQGEDYRPLYAGLDNMNTRDIMELLEQNDIEFKLDAKNRVVLVPADEIHNARMKLAELGLPDDATQGFELMDKEQPLGTSQFMENARYKRSLEGELARTIASIQSVRKARVHLAIPKRSVFVRDAREPRASIFIDLYSGRKIQPGQIQAISNLVASSIPELKLENVTVVDQKGNLLSRGEENQELLMAGKQRDYARKIESDLNRRISGILQPLLGDNGFKAEVSADIDFTQVEQAEEVFNPDLPAIRSEQVLDEQRSTNGQAAGIPGALTNQPPAAGNAPEVAQAGAGANANAGGSGNLRSQATRNYELDRTVSYTRHQQGRIRRLSVAVVVDDRITLNAETGEKIRTPWTEVQLQRMAILVRDSVGFSAARGDSVNVLNSPFFGLVETIEVEPQIWEQDWFINIAKQFAGIFIIAVLILGLLRPLLNNLASTGKRRREAEEAAEMAALEAAEIEGFDSLSEDAVTLTGGETLALPSPEESYDAQLNAIKGLIAEDAGRVALVLKEWIVEEE